VWNASDKRMELCKTFDQEPIGLSVHPSGMYIAVAFKEKVQILSLLLEEIYLVREIDVRGLRQCGGVKYSKGGQLLACINGPSLQLYDAHTGVTRGTLRGHTSQIRSMHWLQHDSKVCVLCVCVCMYVCLCMCMYVCLCMCMCVYVCVYVCVCVCMCVYVCMCVCVCVCVCMCVYGYVYVCVCIVCIICI
jgi:hypothetical protein